MNERTISIANSIVGHSRGRNRSDFYSTPECATLALLEREQFPGTIWEPACGKGAISKVLINRGLGPVLSTDLHDYNYGTPNVDFLKTIHKCDHVITNPPYRLAQEFIQHALSVTNHKVAMLLKLTFLEGQKRYPFWQSSPLKTVYVFSKRLQMFRNDEPRTGGGMICFAWYVWEHNYTEEPRIRWIL